MNAQTAEEVANVIALYLSLNARERDRTFRFMEDAAERQSNPDLDYLFTTMEDFEAYVKMKTVYGDKNDVICDALDLTNQQVKLRERAWHSIAAVQRQLDA